MSKIILKQNIEAPDISNQYFSIRTGSAGMRFQKAGDDYGKLLSVLPWIRHVFPEKSDYINLRDGNEGLYKFIKLIVDKHLETFDDSHERNFIDLYIREMKAQQEQGIKNPVFHCKNKPRKHNLNLIS